MFDYDFEVSDFEEIFIVKEKIEPFFNLIDVSFQLLDGPFNKVVALLNKKTDKTQETLRSKSYSEYGSKVKVSKTCSDIALEKTESCHKR